ILHFAHPPSGRCLRHGLRTEPRPVPPPARPRTQGRPPGPRRTAPPRVATAGEAGPVDAAELPARPPARTDRRRGAGSVVDADRPADASALRPADRVLRAGRRAPAPPAAGPDAPLHPADALAGGTDAGVAAEVAVRGFRRGPGPLAGLARGRRAAAARLPGGVRAALLSRLGSGANRRGAAGHAADGDAAVV